MLYKALASVIKGAFRLSTLGMEMGPTMIRYQMYERIAQVMAGHESRGGRKCLSISGYNDDLANCIPVKLDIVEARYPEYNITDLHQFEDESFDYVISDQVFEHIEGVPHDAMAETMRVLKPGGIAIHTTCFFNEVHGAPYDFWRFTPLGLHNLCERAGFSEVINAEGWGNRIAFIGGLRYLPVPKAEWHPLHKIATSNDPVQPFSVWVIARK